MKYVVKFLSKEDDRGIYTINPPMIIDDAQRILRDLGLMGLTAWLEKI